MKYWRRLFAVAVVLLAFYVSVSMFAWALRYPEMTQTQNLLHFWDAMVWQ